MWRVEEGVEEEEDDVAVVCDQIYIFESNLYFILFKFMQSNQI